MLNTVDPLIINSKTWDAINATINTAVKEVLDTKNNKIKKAWTNGYKKGYKDRKNKS